MTYPPTFRALLGFMRIASRYFRYETEGFEHIRDSPSALVVAYHGRPFAWDYYCLAVRMVDELGYYPRTFTLHTFQWIPILRQLARQSGALYEVPDARQLAALKARGEHLVVLPGGSREALRPVWIQQRVDFGRRRGYLRLALAADLPIIPVVASGVDRAYVGINDGYRLSHRLFGHGKIPLWIGLGIGGIWPLALPLPVHIRQRIGAPISLSRLRRAGEDDQSLIERAHALVTGEMQAMLDALGT
ncbi:MAG: acyltransferase [Myxococcales bacterium]|nr:acyltransferase [Myxococcales bacterium]